MTEAPATCPLCGVRMVKAVRRQSLSASNTLTKDHILPRVRGGTACLPYGVDNIRIMCMGCNNRLSEMFHCVGLRAALLAVAIDRRVSLQSVMRQTGVIRASHLAHEADAAKKPAPIRKPYALDAEKMAALAGEHPKIADVWPGVSA